MGSGGFADRSLFGGQIQRQVCGSRKVPLPRRGGEGETGGRRLDRVDDEVGRFQPRARRVVGGEPRVCAVRGPNGLEVSSRVIERGDNAMRKVPIAANELRAGGILACVLTIVFAASSATKAEMPVPQAIFNYVQRPESVYDWEVVKRTDFQGAHAIHLKLVSQRWHGIVWEHALDVYEPKQLDFRRQMLLLVTGGSQPPKLPKEGDLALGFKLATLCGARVAVLHQVPNQPLLGGRKEDDLISETWLRYLATGDETWPLLFPMVKSAVKAMDALQELSRREWDQPVEAFVITGASKRGWTSWLTPVVDRRVIATAPMVIDVLNFRPQMKHQLDSWGAFSEQIIDYTSKGLVKVDENETPRERQLRLMMDPYSYRHVLSLPKLLINGTNDRYWVVDAMKFYWDDLRGPKYVLQIPNAGHSLNGGRDLVMRTIGAFFRHVASRRPLPRVQWQRKDGGRAYRMVVKAQPAPRGAALWYATSKDLDFRDDRWQSQPLEVSRSGEIVAELARAQGRHVAFFVELQYETDGIPYSLCTVNQRD
ncbi:MAG: phenylacetic acid degradation protein [Planctomycetota bacterium]|nr:MAG: phenylacetic acid degradation protein [Planctomycetota bacterium]